MNYFDHTFKGAIIDNDVSAVQHKIEQVGPNVTDENGITPLHYAVLGERSNITAVLLDAGANIEAVDRYGMKPFDLRRPVVNNRQDHRLTAHQAASMGNLEQTRAYISMGGDLHALDYGNYSLMQHAALNGHVEVVAELLSAGADAQHFHPSTTPPVHLAAKSGSIHALEVLLVHGADPSALSPLRQNAAHLASESGNVECLDLLHKHGVDLHAVDLLKQTPMDIALSKSHDVAVRWLEEHGCRHGEVDSDQTLSNTAAASYKQRLLSNASLQYIVGRDDEMPRLTFTRMQ